MGRIQHLRKNGFAVPAAAIQQDLDQLTNVLTKYKPLTCLFLGDLFHSLSNSEWPRLFQTLKQFPDVEFRLIIGNHDHNALPQVPNNWHQQEEWSADGLRFCHEPSDGPGFEICGHLHPTYPLRGKGRQSLRLPCFWLSPNRLVMPAFSSLAGGHNVKPEKGQQIFISDGRTVSEVLSP